MKKSTLLTVASVGAVALTSAMTFAAWDNLTATSTEAAVTFTQINVTEDTTVKLDLTSTENTNLSKTYEPSAEGDVQFNVEGISDYTNTKLTFTPTVTVDGSVSSDVSLVIYKADDQNKKNLLADGDSSITNTNSYKVVVKPNDGAANAVAGKEVKVKVEATLGKTQAN